MRKLLLAAVCLLTTLGWSQGTAASGIPVVATGTGQPIAGATVAVCSADPGGAPTSLCTASLVPTFTSTTLSVACTPNPATKAALYGVGCTNPGLSDGLGNVIVYAFPAACWLEYTGNGIVGIVVMPCTFPALSTTGGVAIKVNGGSTLTSPVNFQNGSAVNGITISFANPSASNVTAAISGALTNAGIANPSTTVNGQTCTLGSTCTINGILSGLTTGIIPQAGSATSIVNSTPQLDNGVTTPNTLTYAGSGGLALTPGGLAGIAGLGQGTAQGLGTNSVGLTAPAAVTSYNYVWPAAAGSGVLKGTNIANTITGSIGPLDLTADVGATILPPANGGTGIASPAAHKLIVGNGTSAMTQLAVASLGTVLTGNTGADPSFSANPRLGGTAVALTGSLGFSGLTSGTVTVQSQDIAGTFNYNLPTTAGTAGDCQKSGGGGTSPMTWGTCGGTPPYSAITAGSNLVAKTEGSSGSLATVGSGQIAGTQNWLYGGMVDPVLTTASSGGSLAANTSISVQIAFNSTLGLSLPTRIVSVATPVGCGTSCSATITAPTLPSWAISYTAYSCQVGACAPLQQTVSNNCVAITGNCVIQVVGTGAAPLTASTAFIQPPNLQTSSCPALVIPTMFIQDSNGNYQTQAGVDAFFDNTNGPTGPGGTLTFCRRVWFNDVGTSPPLGKNAMVNMRHRFATGTALTNQDRALSILADNGTTDTSTHYGLEGIQAELDFQGAPTAINGSPDGEVMAASFQMSDAHTNSVGFPPFGVGALRLSTFRAGTGTYSACSYCLFGANIMVTNQSASSFGGAFMVGLDVMMTDTGGSSNASSIGIHINTPGNRFINFNRALQIDQISTNVKDFNIYSVGAGANGRNFFGGNVYLPNIITAAADIAVTGSLVASGSLGAAQFATPAFGNPSVAVSGTPGSTTWSYKITAVDGNGRESPASAIGTTTTGNATLTGGNFNQIILSGPYVLGVGRYNVYRTAAGGTPSTTGKIGTATIASTVSPAQGLALPDVFNDTGLAGDGTTPPTVNMTGSIQGANFNTITNCAAAGTAANPSVASCTGAAAGSVSCATAASTGTCTVNTTAVTANSEILITQRTDTTTGTRLSVTCNTTIDTVQRAVTAVVAGTSFTFNLGTITTNPECFSYSIIN